MFYTEYNTPHNFSIHSIQQQHNATQHNIHNQFNMTLMFQALH